jgi:hypothetical protein
MIVDYNTKIDAFIAELEKTKNLDIHFEAIVGLEFIWIELKKFIEAIQQGEVNK